MVRPAWPPAALRPHDPGATTNRDDGSAEEGSGTDVVTYAFGLPPTDTSVTGNNGPGYGALLRGCESARSYLSSIDLDDQPFFGFTNPRYVAFYSAGLAIECAGDIALARRWTEGEIAEYGLDGTDRPGEPRNPDGSDAPVDPPRPPGYGEPECDLYRTLASVVRQVDPDSLECHDGTSPLFRSQVWELSDGPVVMWDDPCTFDLDESAIEPPTLSRRPPRSASPSRRPRVRSRAEAAMMGTATTGTARTRETPRPTPPPPPSAGTGTGSKGATSEPPGQAAPALEGETPRILPSSRPMPTPTGGESGSPGRMVKALVAVLVNVGVLTALLVYFGWVRSDRMATFLGIDEAILGMTVDDYVRRSVRSVFFLPIVAALRVWCGSGSISGGIGGVLAAATRPDGSAGRSVAVGRRRRRLPGRPAPLARRLRGDVHRGALVCAAACCSSSHMSLRAHLPGSVGFAPLTDGVLRGSVAVLVAVGLFWSATNFATVEGTELAREFPSCVSTLPSVEIDSAEPLASSHPASRHLPGRRQGRALPLPRPAPSRVDRRNYFLISDDWTPQYGVVVVLPIGSEYSALQLLSATSTERIGMPPTRHARRPHRDDQRRPE